MTGVTIFVTTVFQQERFEWFDWPWCESQQNVTSDLNPWASGMKDGATTPKAEDIITFNWDQNSQQNNGFADHIGIVEEVSNGIIHTIEGNSNNQVIAIPTESDIAISRGCNPSLSIIVQASFEL